MKKIQFLQFFRHVHLFCVKSYLMSILETTAFIYHIFTYQNETL